MECPVCRESMVVIEYRSIELDYCVGCMGVWFDRGEIDLLLRNASLPMLETGLSFRNPLSGSREIVRPCPLCGKSMIKITPGDGSVVLDQCPDQEGFWFDAGELAATLRQVPGTDQEPVIKVLRDFLGEALGESKKNNTD